VEIGTAFAGAVRCTASFHRLMRTRPVPGLPAGATFSGYPAVDRALWLRQSAALKQLPELLREVRELRARVAALESNKDESPP